jgi:hypothetical protein
VEYGGAVDVMSNVDVKGDLSTYHQWRMGILKNTDVVQIWNSQTIDLKYTNSPIGTRAIFIRDGKSTYWIEYRKAMDGYTPGLAIYRTDPPPASAVISPNIKDGIEAPSEFVTSDVWLMNLDNFEYSIVSTASGSPTLPLGKTFLDSSGNVSVSAILKDANTVSVTVERKSDLNPPPTPSLSNTLFWNSPEAELITPGYEDGETTISKFQISMDEEIKDISGGNSAYWYPTYLTPLNPNKTIRVKDLPEGEYSLKIRAVDVFGNISDWSQAVKVSIDRGAPVVTSEIKASTLPNIGTKVIWSGAKDIGSGVCSIQVLNTDGFVVARSDRNTNQTFNPELIFKGEVGGKAQVFDCRGNGVEGNFSVNQVNVSASIARSTGKTKLVNGDMTCNGNCSFSMSINGDLEINISKGSANVFVNNAQVGVAKAGTSPVALSLGKANKVIRIQGKDISFKGLTKFSGSWKQTGTVQRKVTAVDASLENQEQMSISKYGFQISDFEQSYQLLPISRGTTLLDATLDICNGDFPSEKSRVLRRQVAATRVGSPYSFMSTETVRYKNNESAASSLTDIDAVVAKCKITGGAVSGQDVITKYEFSPSPTFNYATGVTGRVVLTLIGSGADSRWLLGFFQVKDDLAVNTYLVRAEKFTDADIKRWSQVASEISTRLSGYTPVNSVV